jgi:erythromycin esterase
LIEELGFTTFAMESSFANGILIDRYLQTGEGDLGAFLDADHFVWNTNEVFDMLEWLRAINSSRAPSDRVTFWGVDVQDPLGSINQVLAYVAKVLPGELDQLRTEYRCLEALGGLGYGDVPKPMQDQCRVGVEAAMRWFDENRELLIEASSPEEYNLAARHARVAVQSEAVASAVDQETSDELRDRYMAENALWVLVRARPGRRLIMWAHNAHVARASLGPGPPPMGSYLADELGPDHLVVGFEFSQGEVSSLRSTSGGVEPEIVSVSPPPENSYASAFSSTGLAQFALDLRDLPESPAGDWLTEARPLRSIGTVYDPERPAETIETVSIPRVFDVIVFVHDTTATAVRYEID